MKTKAPEISAAVLLPPGTIPAGIHTPAPGIDLAPYVGSASLIINSSGTYSGAGLQVQLQESTDSVTWVASTSYGTIFNGAAPQADSPQGVSTTRVTLDTESVAQYIRPRLVSTGNFGMGITLLGARGHPSAVSIPAPIPVVLYFRLSEFSQNLFVPTLTGPTDGISGVTYSPVTGTIFAVRNVSGQAGHIYEYDLAGNLLRTITNSNFVDTEGLCWMYGDTFAIAEENPNNRLTVVTIAPGQTTLNRNNHLSTSFSSGFAYANLGIEGVAYDPVRDLLYFITEKSSLGTNNTGVWSLNVMNPSTGAVSVLFSLIAPLAGLATDVADIHYDSDSNQFYLLSEESDRIVRLSYTGTVLESLAIAGMNQPEGLSFTPDMRTMFVVGEVREYARYQR